VFLALMDCWWLHHLLRFFSPLFGGTPQNRQTRPDLDGSNDFGVSITSSSFSTSTVHRHDGATQIVASIAPVCTIFVPPFHS
jgi:hypothetical protein